MKNVFYIVCAFFIYFSEEVSSSMAGYLSNDSECYDETTLKIADSICKEDKELELTNEFSELNKDFLSAPNHSASKSIQLFKDLSKHSELLNVFVFNVGQANCIILRCGKEVAIVDAGKNMDNAVYKRCISNKIKTVMEGSLLKAVFITHPHKDHYSLISELITHSLEQNNLTQGKTLGSQNKHNIKFFLGGAEDNWKNAFAKMGLDKKSEEIKIDVTYIMNGVSQNTTARNIFSNSNIVFQFILPKQLGRETETKSDVFKGNSLSFVLKVTHKTDNCSFLFTGDAEGINLERIVGEKSDKKEDSKEFGVLELLSKERAPTKSINNSSFMDLDSNSNDRSPTNKIYDNFKHMLDNIGCAVLPHHGSATNGSLDFADYLENRPIPPAIFLISSIVKNKDMLPRKSVWSSLLNRGEHPAHFISYCNNGKKKIKLTKKRLYVTETAPGCVYWMLSDGRTIWLYNAYKDKDSDLGFFPITPVKLTDLNIAVRNEVSTKITYCYEGDAFSTEIGSIVRNLWQSVAKWLIGINTIVKSAGSVIAHFIYAGSDRLEDGYKQLHKKKVGW